MPKTTIIHRSVTLLRSRIRADQAEQHDERRHDRLGQIQHLDQRPDREIAEQAHADHAEEHRREDRVDERRLRLEDLRSRLHAVQQERAEDDGGRAAARNAERQQRHHVAADRRGRCDLRRDDAFGDAAAELLRGACRIGLRRRTRRTMRSSRPRPARCRTARRRRRCARTCRAASTLRRAAGIRVAILPSPDIGGDANPCSRRTSTSPSPYAPTITGR